MNGYERIQAAMKGEKPDKIPVMLHKFMLAAKEAEISMTQFRKRPKNIADVFIKSVEKYEFDGILVDLDTVTLAGAVGVPVDFPKDESARSHKENLISLEDVKNLKKGNIENYQYVQNWLEATRLLKTHFKNEIFVRGNCDQAPFSLASMMRGSQEWMLDLIWGNRAADRITGILYRYQLPVYSVNGANRMRHGFHWRHSGRPRNCVARNVRNLRLTLRKRVVDEANKFNLPYTLHICGNTDTILDIMLQSGSDAFELDYKTDTQKSFNLIHDKICLIGNIDPSGIIAMGTPELVEQKTIEPLNIFTKTKRFILNAGCAIPSNTPEENLRMMIKTAREFRT